MTKKALIVGISGQDGSLLAQLLLKKGYKVFGSSRDIKKSNLKNLVKLNILNKCKFFSLTLKDPKMILRCVKKVKPDEIYNLSGQSSVSLSFKEPRSTSNSIINPTLFFLEAIRKSKKKIKFYNACSSECFGSTGSKAANENTPFRPKSPYGVSKATAFLITKVFRESFGIFATSGILFNHDSSLRPDKFVTKKIIKGVVDIYNKKKNYLDLGNIDIVRDWGWAEEYVKAMHLILQQEKPQDFVIATGKSYALRDFVKTAFKVLNLQWKKHVRISKHFVRPSDIKKSLGNPKKANNILKWKAKYTMKKIVNEMIKSELNKKI